MKVQSVKVLFASLSLLTSLQSFSAAQRITCPIPTVSMGSREETIEYLTSQRVRLLNPEKITDQELYDFLTTFVRFPRSFHKAIMAAGGDILLLNGKGVSEDPNWRKDQLKTVEGNRDWSGVAGSGGHPPTGEPTRIVSNRIYDEEGTIDLFIHEYAHTLDAIYGEATISKSREWLQALKEEPNLKNFLMVLNPDGYTFNFPLETFAELFTQYYACEASRAQMETEIPRVAAYFKGLTVEDLPALREERRIRAAAEAALALEQQKIAEREAKEKAKILKAQRKAAEKKAREEAKERERIFKAQKKAAERDSQQPRSKSEKVGEALDKFGTKAESTFGTIRDSIFGRRNPNP